MAYDSILWWIVATTVVKRDRGSQDHLYRVVPVNFPRRSIYGTDNPPLGVLYVSIHLKLDLIEISLALGQFRSRRRTRYKGASGPSRNEGEGMPLVQPILEPGTRPLVD